MVNWSQESILVTGGTGSFGKKFVEIMLRDYHPQRLVIFSRDELKQHEMRTSSFDHSSLRYFIGDVRDVERLKRALSTVTVVVHETGACPRMLTSVAFRPETVVLRPETLLGPETRAE